MIYKLRKRFIKISVLSVTTVLLTLFTVVAITSVHQLNGTIDDMADTLAQNDGKFPEDFEFPSREAPSDSEPLISNNGITFSQSGFITPESRFTTRFFVVRFDDSGNITESDIKQISSITDEDAKAYAEKVLSGKSDRGWISDFRYKKYETDEGKSILFVDGTINKNMTFMFISSLAVVFAVTAVIIILLLVLFSKKAIKPIAESYEKQKRFITDASHELKTPLTVIMTDLDIIESDNGKSEWIDDIRAEGENMTDLVSQLVNLSRMDEKGTEIMNICTFSLSDLCMEFVNRYSYIAKEKNLTLTTSIDDYCNYNGDEKLIRQFISVFMDNAIKYCDEKGKISFSLKKEKHPVIEISNTYSNIDNLDLDKLKERFYRADKSRTSGNGYGIGLSIADSIISMHKGKIKIYKASDNMISFRVTL